MNESIYINFIDTTSFCCVGTIKSINLGDGKLKIEILTKSTLHDDVHEAQDIILYVDKDKLKTLKEYIETSKGSKDKYNFFGSIAVDTYRHVLFYCTHILAYDGKEVI